jgi:shikimate kinase
MPRRRRLTGVRRPLFLTGMMGCGKTTVGRALAHAQGVPLVDLDARIERVFGASVPELWAALGEPGFRALEAQALGSLLAEPGLSARGVVVATGGGAVLLADSREAMDRVGLRVYLEVGADELVRRLQAELEADPAARPRLQGGPDGGGPLPLRRRVVELLAARGSIYRAGALSVDGHGDPAAVAARVAAVAGGQGTVAAPRVACDPEAPVRGSEAV